MSASTQAENEVSTQELLTNPRALLNAASTVLEADWTVFYPLILLLGAMGLGIVVTISGTGDGPEVISVPSWAALLVQALMPLAVFLLYPIGIVATYLVARWVFGAGKMDVLLAFAILVGMATATKAAAIMLGAIF